MFKKTADLAEYGSPYFTIMKMLATNEEVEPVLQKRVLKYANRLNLEHFTQFRIPITEMSPADYENLKNNTKLTTFPVGR